MNEHSGYGQPTGTGTIPMNGPSYGHYDQPSNCNRGYDYDRDDWNLSPWNSTSAKNFGAAYSDDPRIRHAGVGGGNLSGGTYYSDGTYYGSQGGGGQVINLGEVIVGLVVIIGLLAAFGLFVVRGILRAMNGVRR